MFLNPENLDCYIRAMNAADTHERMRANAMVLIRTCRTMTLATMDGKTAWAAPVYYVFEKNVFYFFSDPNTRHIRDIEATGRAAAAVYADADGGWRQLKGLQMEGRVERIGPGRVAARAIRAYLEKFPFVSDMAPKSIITDLSFFASKFRAHLYGFSPETVIYMDNAIQFGFRETISLQ